LNYFCSDLFEKIVA